MFGLVGGLALAGLAAARRTQASFSTYLATTNPSDFTATLYGSTLGNNPGYSPAVQHVVAELPGVKHAAAAVVLNAFPLSRTGIPDLASEQVAYPIGSLGRYLFEQDRATALEGRLPDPRRSDEMAVTADAARLLGFHVGETIEWGVYSSRQTSLPGFGTATVKPAMRSLLTVVGIVAFSSDIVEDDIDRVPTFEMFTPSFTKEILSEHGQFAGATVYGIQIAKGHTLAAVQREMTGVVQARTVETIHDQAPVAAKADRSIRPIAIALGAFGGITLLAALLIGAQAAARRLRDGFEEQVVLRAIGSSATATLIDSMLGLALTTVFGALLAAIVAIVLSPVAPLGPARSVSPDKGIAIDWTVIGFGVLLLIVAMLAIVLILAVRGAPHRTARRLPPARPATSSVSMASAFGLPATGIIGARMALEPGRGRTSVPVRSALIATTLAVLLVIANLVFGSSLSTLVSSPALYGWNWDYMFNPIGGNGGDVPPQVLHALQRDHNVESYTSVDYSNAELDGQNIPFLFIGTPDRVQPPILSGHGIQAKHQIVLGAATMAQLHKHVGDTVAVSYGSKRDFPVYVPPTTFTIVGTATFPAVGFASQVSDHTSMGTGAMMLNADLPETFLAAQENPDPTLNGPNLVFVRLRAGVSARAGRVDASRLAKVGDRAFAAVPDGQGAGDLLVVDGAQRPAEIVNYKTMSATPELLGAALAVGAMAALALTLASSVRRRRRDLALLKTLGFTQRQLLGAVAWQSTITTLVGLLIGIPLGVLLGRWLWILFARLIYAVPEPTVPWVPIALVTLGALVVANVVAAIPGRVAARTPTAILLRSE
jgi:hypothetical protein